MSRAEFEACCLNCTYLQTGVVSSHTPRGYGSITKTVEISPGDGHAGRVEFGFDEAFLAISSLQSISSTGNWPEKSETDFTT